MGQPREGAAAPCADSPPSTLDPPPPPPGAPSSKKVAALQNDVAALEAALASAQSEYERVKARNVEVRGWLGGRP